MVASLVRKVAKKVKKGENNEVGKKERSFFDVVSKEGLIEFFTGIRLDKDLELSALIMGHQMIQTEGGTGRGGKKIGKRAPNLEVKEKGSSSNR